MGAVETSGRLAKCHVGKGLRRDDARRRRCSDVSYRAGARQRSKRAELDMRMSARMRSALLIAGLRRQARMANLKCKRAVARRHESGRYHRLKQQRQEHGPGNQPTMSAIEAKSFHLTSDATRRSGGTSIPRNEYLIARDCRREDRSTRISSGDETNGKISYSHRKAKVERSALGRSAHGR